MSDSKMTIYKNRIAGLIEKGNQVAASAQPSAFGGDIVDSGLFHGWRSQSLSYLVNLLGVGHVYTKSFEVGCKDIHDYEVEAGKAILRAVQEDLENGYFVELVELVHAATFADFLEMADYLMTDGGYKDAAAVIAGGVLEVHLRQLCQKNNIAILGESGRPKKADKMNADLHNGDVYSLLDQKIVTAWLDLRNKAAHANYSEYNGDQVVNFIQALREFLARVPA